MYMGMEMGLGDLVLIIWEDSQCQNSGWKYLIRHSQLFVR